MTATMSPLDLFDYDEEEVDYDAPEPVFRDVEDVFTYYTGDLPEYDF